IVRVKFKSKGVHAAQQENYIIDAGYYWLKEGRYIGSLDLLLDNPVSLWLVGHSSYNGKNDRVPESLISAPGPSLYFIRPEALHIIVRVEGAEFGNSKKRVRARFVYRGYSYL